MRGLGTQITAKMTLSVTKEESTSEQLAGWDRYELSIVMLLLEVTEGNVRLFWKDEF